MHLKKVTTLLLTLLLSLSFIAIFPTLASPAEVKVKAIASVTQLGDPVLKTDVVGAPFSVAFYVEDTDPGTDMDLYGFDVQLNWSTQWIHYTGKGVTVPVESFPGVQTPSPYAGILHADTMKLKEAVDESASIPDAEAGTMAWIGYSSSAPAPSFNGSGTMFVFTFVVNNQPYCYAGNATIKFHWTKTDLSKCTPVGPIAHDAIDLEIPLYCRNFTYPASPMLKVLPEDIVAPSDCVCENFTVDIMLLGADGADLNSFWDVAGCDFYLYFNTTLIEAVDVDIDPDGDFGAFWDDGTFELAKDIDNAEGSVHIAFMGIGGTHSAVFGTIRIAEVTFHMIYEHIGYPPPSAPIYINNMIYDLANPSTWYILDAENGLIDLTDPITTQWHTLFPYSLYCTGFSLDSWEDKDGNGKLSVGDQIDMTNKNTDKKHWYYVDCVQITLNLTMYPFSTLDDNVWATDSWTDYGAFDYSGLTGRTTESVYGFDGQGHADWTGNFTLDYPWASVNSMIANHQDGTSTVLTPGVDYKVHAGDQKVELLTPIDTHIINEYYVAGQNGTPAGWPGIKYVATSISSVYVKFPNGTERGTTGGFGCFETGPPCEWWFEPDYPNELEGWWVLDWDWMPFSWPTNTSYWINYTAGSYLTIDYNAVPPPIPYYLEFDGTLDEFEAITDPNCTWWHEVYPDYSNMWHCISTDTIEVCHNITLEFDGLIREFHIAKISTDILVIQKRFVQDKVPTDPYYLDYIMADIAGYPHPDRDFSPWYSSPYAIALPNEVEDAMYTSCYKVLGRQIDLYLCAYPDGHNGRGPNRPGDMFWPQKEVCLCAEVTYNLWPEQQKDVAFEVIDPYGAVYTLLCTRTDSTGLAMICFRLPWMCDDPEYYFGEWTVIASVDVACEHINDTMTFKYDYMVHIWKVTTDASSYAHGECIEVTIDYGCKPTTFCFQSQA